MLELKTNFSGPLFVVGFPRSGTQLLRALLNRHQRIAIATNESGFIPTVLKQFGTPSRLEDPKTFSEFFGSLSRSNFFSRMRDKGLVISQEELFRTKDTRSWELFFEVIFRFYASSAGPNAERFIWGDKTPGYLMELASFGIHFPNARFMHIVRDARDVSLSVNRRWHTPFEYTAEEWRSQLDSSRHVGSILGASRYLELRYEDLLEDPEREMVRACAFLDVDFSPEMIELGRPSSRSGDAGRSSEIVKANREKWRTLMKEADILRVERVAYPQLLDLRYPITLATAFEPVDAKRQRTLRVLSRAWRLVPQRRRPRKVSRGED
jgi:hypothetical protein